MKNSFSFCMSKSELYCFLNVLVIILVVFAHSSLMYTNAGIIHPAETSALLGFLTKAIYSFHMPLCFMVSGMVYGLCKEDLKKYTKFTSLLKNKARRLLLPYFLFGILYVAPVMCWLGLTDLSFVDYCFKGILLSQNSRHLWYLVTLFEMFLLAEGFHFTLTHCLLILTRKRGAKYSSSYLYYLGLLTGSILLLILSGYFPNLFQINSLGYYFIFFSCGMFFNHFFSETMPVLRNKWMLLVFMFCFAFLQWYPWPYSSALKALMGCIIIIGLSHNLPTFLLRNRWLRHIHNNSMGIYLFHPMLIYIMFFFFGQFHISPIILWLCIATIAYILSYILTETLNLAGLNFILGESSSTRK